MGSERRDTKNKGLDVKRAMSGDLKMLCEEDSSGQEENILRSTGVSSCGWSGQKEATLGINLCICAGSPVCSNCNLHNLTIHFLLSRLQLYRREMEGFRVEN